MTIVYLIFLLLAIYFSLKYDAVEEENPKKNHRFWLLCVILIFISGMSYGLGGDKFEYMEEFENYPHDLAQLPQQIGLGFLLRSQMPGWVIMNMLCKKVFDSFYAVQFVEAICINVSVCYFVRNYTKRYFLFLIIYFVSFTYFMFNTDIMREAMSMSFVLFGYTAYVNGHKAKFYILVLAGLLFHFTAGIALLFPLAKVKYSHYTFYMAFAIAFVLWAGSDILITHVLSRLGGTGNLIKKVFLYSIQASTIFGFLRSSITYIVFPFITMYYAIKWEEDPELAQKKKKFYSFQIPLAVIASSFVGLIRVQNYAHIMYLVMLTDFVYLLFKKEREHQGMRLMNAIGIFVFFIWQYSAYWPKTGMYYFQLWFPYTTGLNEFRDVEFRAMGHSEALNPEQDDKNQRDVDL